MNNRQTHSKGDIVFHIFNTLLMILILICTLYPFWYVIVSSLSSISHVTNSVVLLWPDGLHWDSYQQVFRNNLVPVAYGNTLFVTLIGTAVSMLLTSLSAFVLSRKELPGNKVMTLFVVFTMLFNAGLVPFYLQVKNLHLLNSRWSLIWPFALSTYNTVILRNFFKSVPNALYEAASIDGSGYIGYFFRILLPLSMPSIATITLFYAVSYWNAYFYSILFITDRALYPIQAILRQILMSSEFNTLLYDDATQSMPSEMLKCAMIVITALPIICVYPFLQRYFVKGIMVGSLKG
ncbi:MAG: carbohydrate ABC transporter permease [Candidatus Faecivicinus sp.]|nr:carbohydrate ABC transporter permease [Candidatus Faecivicinus sp.]